MFGQCIHRVLTQAQQMVGRVVYNRRQLYELRSCKQRLPGGVLDIVAELGLLRYRGCRAGARATRSRVVLRHRWPTLNVNTNTARFAGGLPIVIGHRPIRLCRTDASVVRVPVRTPIPRTQLLNAVAPLRTGFFNARSLNNKAAAVRDVISGSQRNVYAVVETWHDDAFSPSLIQTCPAEYNFTECARPRTKDNDHSTAVNHGGICIFYNKKLKVSRHPLPVLHTMEVLAVRISTVRRSIMFIVVYRPGSRPVTGVFFDELESVLDSIVGANCDFVILGDFNIHVDIPDDANAIRLADVIDAYNLRQHVKAPTHDQGHTLDLVITSEGCVTSNLTVSDLLLSDHHSINFDIRFETVTVVQRAVTKRNWSNFDVIAFEQDLAVSELASTNSADVNFLFDAYTTTLTQLLDKHAPKRTTTPRTRPDTPWFDAECRDAKKMARRLEGVARRSRSRRCHHEWRAAVHRYHQLLNNKQQQFWSNRVRDADGDSRKLWKTLSKLLSPPAPTPFFSGDEFAKFFADKVATIRSNTADAPPPIIINPFPFNIASYNTVTANDVSRLISRCPTKQCTLDPIPTWLLKALNNTLPAILSKLINASLTTATFPAAHKHAVITPIIKKPSMDSTQLSSYRPISNLSFVSKLLERVIAGQLTDYLNSNSLFPPLQSAYRRGHSTETALVKICNDALMAADQGMITLVVLLDYSAAFDTVDHVVALNILQKKYGVTGSALQWHASYLSERTCAVNVTGVLSSTTSLDCSLPQGSTLGPLKYILYASELHDVVLRHGVSFHGFADDSQLCKHLYVKDIVAAKRTMVDCVNDVQLWSQSHRLQLNAAKSEVLWLGTRQQLSKLSADDKELRLATSTLTASQYVRNLGVYVDEQLSMEVQARNCSKACHYHLRRLRQIRRFVDQNALRSLVHAFVTTRLDYCNALYADCRVAITKRLQRIQNCAARLICNETFMAHVSPLLRQLHWLPVKARVTYKLCVLMYDISSGSAPAFLCSLCNRCDDTRLRSAARKDYTVQRTRTRMADSAFCVAGPRAWNALPTDIRETHNKSTFCQKLKTHMFAKVFN